MAITRMRTKCMHMYAYEQRQAEKQEDFEGLWVDKLITWKRSEKSDHMLAQNKKENVN